MSRKICWLALICFLRMAETPFAKDASADAPHDAVQANVENTLPFSLTISGGISLGSYEAGVNWALIDLMKQLRSGEDFQKKKPELKSITGASAGAINAIMSALLWCVDNEALDAVKNGTETETTTSALRCDDNDDPQQQGRPQRSVKNAVSDNVIRNTWLAVGVDELMPSEDGNKYCNPKNEKKDKSKSDSRRTEDESRLVDSMFARSAFADSVFMIRRLLNQQVFTHERMTIDIALLATREIPTEIEHCSVNVKNQRYVFLLQFETDGSGKGYFRSNKVKKIDSNLGTIVYLPQKKIARDGSRYVDPDDVIRLMYASSAFPVAFGKVNLTYCTDEHENSVDKPGECPENTYAASADFIDGGVFDNIPLGAALALRKARVWESMPGAHYPEVKKEVAKTYYFFISPSNRRNVPEKFRDPLWKKPRTFGIEGMLGFIPGFVAAASDHELYTVLRSGDWKSYRQADTPDSTKYSLVVTDRYFPITGAYLGHFGAFLDQPFREFDYNAGVYDTVNGMATLMCYVNHSNENENCDNADGKRAQSLYQKLDMEKDKGASEVFYLIAKQEHREASEDPNNGWHWINNLLPDTPGPMHTIFNSIIDTSPVPLTDDDSDKTFSDFIKNLRKNKYAPQSQTMKWMTTKSAEDVTVWYTPLIRRAGARLRTLQAFESRVTNNEDVKFLVNTGALGLDRYFNYNDKVFSLPNTVPEQDQSLCPLLKCDFYPYELGADTGNGGLFISYLGRLNFPSTNYSVDLKLTPIGYSKYGDSRVIYSQTDLYLSYNHIYNVGSAGFGPTYDHLWKTEGLHQDTIGTSIYFEILQTVRITVGIRDYTAEHMFGHNYYWTFGIVDIPGILSH